MSAVFAPLQLHDSLPARIARVWSPTWTPTVTVTFWWPHPLDDSLTETTVCVRNRAVAAADLREARRQGLLIERSTKGWEVELSPLEFPHWTQQ